MKFLPKFLLLIVFLILTFLSYIYLKDYDFSGVLQATSSSASFKNFSVVNIEQYPKITYLDSNSDTLESRFSIIRKYSQPTKFTHHLCNNVNESSSAWRSGSTCSDYKNPNPRFVKLNFDQGPKLILYTHYGIYSIDSENNKVKWQSSHIDRFLSNDINSCEFKYDPTTIIPVKSDNKFYLYSLFSGLNTRTCLQFYDESRDSKSFSTSGRRLILGYELNSNGELNRDYNRTGTRYELINNIPFGPGPKNSTSYANNPIDEIIGCGRFDSSKNCLTAKGVIKNYELKSKGTPQYGKCLKEITEWVDGYVRCALCTTEYTYPFGTGGYSKTTTVCAKQIGKNPVCGANKNPGTTVKTGSWDTGQWTYRMTGTWAVREPSLDYEKKTCISREFLGYSGAYFSASMSYPIFSKYTNYNLNENSWNIRTTSQPPSDFQIYQNELDRDSNPDAPLNFTSLLNKEVFITNNFIFKFNKNSNSIELDRYELKSEDYNLGGSSYINKSSKFSKTIGNSSFSNYSLDFYKNDIFVMVSGNTGFDFYRIRNLNNSISNISIDNLTSEITNKIPVTTYGRPKSFGIVGNKIFIVTNQSVLVSEITETEEPPILLESGYKNFEFNGNVYTKENLTSGFLFTSPSEKFRGNILTPNNIEYNLKSFKNTSLSFNYPNNITENLLNFSQFNASNFSKFNQLYENVTYSEGVPLQSSQYTNLNPTSNNNFEIINVSKGKGVRIDLNNQNIIKDFNKYILINSDKNNKSRIFFYADCNNPSYSIICSGVKFNFKGGLLGNFYFEGNLNSLISGKRFIRIHEYADAIVELSKELKNKRYGRISSTLIFVQYE